MRLFGNIRSLINKILKNIRNIFIQEKQRYVSVKTLDNINLNFKNLSPYSEINSYQSIFILFLSSIFLFILFFFTYKDIKSNLTRNEILIENIPTEIIIENPLISNNIADIENIEYIIKKNDTIIDILTNKINISYQDANNCINSLQKVINLKNIKIGQKISLKIKNNLSKDKNGNFLMVNQLKELKFINDSLLKTIIVSTDDEGKFISSTENIKQISLYNKYIVFIRNGLYVDAIQAGVPIEIIMTLINYYSFDIDFQRDLRSGDMLEVVFEAKYTETGKKVSNGNIIFANLKTNKRNYNLYRYSENDKFIGYFDEDGLSTQKSLLKTPINGARISSGFSLRRKHPVLGYTREHKAIDFAAPTGTPIYAAGNGKIIKAVSGCLVGNRRCGGGFGNYIQVQHTEHYITEYAHMSRLNPKMREGIPIKQGEIIGYVGTTGISTGPHLHYGIIHRGERINPTQFKTLPTVKLKGEQLLTFMKEKDKINILRKTAINQNSAI